MQFNLSLRNNNYLQYLNLINPPHSIYNSLIRGTKKIFTVTSHLFTHIVSVEKMRKDMRDRKDMRGTNYT